MVKKKYYKKLAIKLQDIYIMVTDNDRKDRITNI